MRKKAREYGDSEQNKDYAAYVPEDEELRARTHSHDREAVFNAGKSGEKKQYGNDRTQEHGLNPFSHALHRVREKYA